MNISRRRWLGAGSLLPLALLADRAVAQSQPAREARASARGGGFTPVRTLNG
jgi:hypothetical protein